MEFGREYILLDQTKIIEYASKKLEPKVMYVIKFEIAIGMIEAKAYSYELVNSRISIIAVIGPPITELHTAAMPETASTAFRLLSKLNMGILKIILPAQTPINRAGDKIPPNNPKPIHKEVKNILRINLQVA